MTRRKKILVTILVMVLVLPIGTPYPCYCDSRHFSHLIPFGKAYLYQRTAAAHDTSQGSR